MVWGTYGSRRAQQPDVGTTDIPPPRLIHCGRCCSSFVLMQGQEMPPKWEVVAGSPVCSDCLRGASPLVTRALRSISTSSKPRRFHGCRIGHEVALGFVALQIRAGASAPAGRDEAVNFMLDALELDKLIIELGAIAGELKASQIPGTAAREGGLNG